MRLPPIRRGWTYSEFARLGADERHRYEVIAGEVFVTPVQSLLHQSVLTTVLCELTAFLEGNELGIVLLGPVDVLLGEGDYLCPDVVFVRRERLGILSDRGVEAAPDLVVEVTSPETADRDRGIKAERYAYYGVPSYWVVDPESRRIEVYDALVDPQVAVTYTGSFTWSPVRGAKHMQVEVARWLADP